MHSDKEEFQVLDSLWRLEQSKDFVEKLVWLLITECKTTLVLSALYLNFMLHREKKSWRTSSLRTMRYQQRSIQTFRNGKLKDTQYLCKVIRESTVNLTPLLLMPIADSLPLIYMQELMWTVPVSMYGALGWRWTNGRIFAGYLLSIVSLLHTCLSLPVI
jgi:hypothetical protein